MSDSDPPDGEPTDGDAPEEAGGGDPEKDGPRESDPGVGDGAAPEGSGGREPDGDGPDAGAERGSGESSDDAPYVELADADVDDPFAELESGPTAGGPAEDPFVRMDVEGVDDADVWAELVGDAGDDEELSVGSDDQSVGVVREAVIPKQSYCQRCEYFSEPPEVACSHPETRIVELVDSRHLRVRNCPVVARRQGLEEDELGTLDLRED